MSCNILFITHDFTRTGAPIVLLNLIKALRLLRPQWTVSVACIYDRGDAQIRASYLNHADRFLGAIPVFETHFWQKTPRFDVILLNTIVGGEVAEKVAPWTDCLLSWIHEMPFTINQYGIALAEELAKQSRSILCVNRFISSFFEKLTPKVHLFHGFTNGPPLEPKQEISSPAPVEKTLTLACCGIPSWHKGIFSVTQLLSRLPESISLSWFGAKASDACMEQILYELHLLDVRNQFIVEGIVSNFTEEISKKDVFLMLSHEDSFPLVCLEAASVNVPTVCWDKGSGISDFVADGAGWVVGYQDFDALAELLNGFSNNRAEIAKRGRRAREKVLAEFTAEVRAGEFIEVLRGLGLSV